MNASMNLLRRLPAKDVPKNLAAISELIQDDEIRDDVTVKTDKPLGKYIQLLERNDISLKLVSVGFFLIIPYLLSMYRGWNR